MTQSQRAVPDTAAAWSRTTASADGIVRLIAVSWGSWRYTVAYAGLGATPAPVAPANARGLDRDVSR
jgi:hypothetical protein